MQRSVYAWASRACACLAVAGLGLVGCSNDGSTDKGADSGTTFLGSTDGIGETGGAEIGGGSDTGAADSAIGDQDEGSDATSSWQPCQEPKAWGCACELASDCDSSFCVDSPEGKVCTLTCIETCPPNWSCLQAGSNDTQYICVPKHVSLCQPCALDADCSSNGSARCIPFDLGTGFVDGSFCGAPCGDVADCPSGYACQSIPVAGEQNVLQCVPEDWSCTCSKASVGKSLSTGCQRTNEFGTCKGVRACSADGLTLCSAVEPTVEVCDSEDNNCDGQTDEDGALGCKVFFPDQDKDGAGLGEGYCLCAHPGPGYANSGGDCNDSISSIGPGAKEICNDVDDNCNGSTDEPGASGCTVYYLDKDSDGFGDPNDAACLCKGNKTPDYVDTPGDCDDQNDKIKPGVQELCDGKDNNCDGKSDEENAQGCTLHYLDIDKDGFGPTDTGVCICKPDAIYPTDKPGDCDDNVGEINPSKGELCNNKDDDCNGTTDDGDAPKSCPLVPGVTPGCKAGVCGVATCPGNSFDIDGKFENGCECSADSNYGKGGGTCATALDAGPLGDGGTTAKAKGNLMPGEAADWYKFQAFDGPDTNDCDTFSVRARLVQGADVFVVDLYRGSCAGKSQVCAGEVDTAWTVAFGGKEAFGPFVEKGQKLGKVVPSPQPFPAGECKCTTTSAPDGPGLPGMNLCTDNSAWFYVAVRYKDGQAPVCAFYELEMTNGIYKP